MTKLGAEMEPEECRPEEIQEEIELALGDGEYILSIFVSPGDTLSIELERKADGATWRGDFTARYLEEVTKRAGNHKSFTSFVKMLQSAISPARCWSPSSLQVDVLTHPDLIEALKDANAVSIEEGSLSPNNVVNIEKRYLILTYSTEFDLVHYSLPLLHEEDFSEVNGMRLCIRRLRHKVAYMKTRLQKYEGGPKVSLKESDRVSPLHKNRVYSDSDTSCDSRFSNSRICKAQVMEIRALNKKVQGLEDKLRMDRMSFNKSITILSKRNTSLEEESRKAKEKEVRLSSKLSDCNFQICLLRGKVKSQGLTPTRFTSPTRNSPHMEPKLRLNSSPLSRGQGCSPSQAYGSLSKGTHINKQCLRSPYSPPHNKSFNVFENKRNWSPNSKDRWRQSPPYVRPKNGNMASPNGKQRKVSSFLSPPPWPYGRQRMFMDQDKSSPYGLERKYPPFISSASLSEERRKSSPFASPSSSPPYAQRAKFPSSHSSPRSQGPSFQSRSNMSSPRYSRPALPLSSISRSTRSQSCPILGEREQERWESYTRKPRPKPRPYSPTPPLIDLQERQCVTHQKMTHRNSTKDTSRIMEGVTSQVGNIDSRLYALQDYLHRMKLDSKSSTF